MNSRKKYSPEMVAEWARLKASGSSAEEIAVKFQVSRTTVYGALQRAALVKRRPSKKIAEVICLRCDLVFKTPRTRSGLPERRICEDCTKYNRETFEGSMFL